MESNDTTTDSDPRGSIVLGENHRPATPSGDFTIQVTQKLHAEARVITEGVPPVPAIDATFPADLRRFSVAGPRFTIAPDLFQNRFPPNGSLGNFHNVLPHLTFARSTLPWERFITPKGHTSEEGVEEINTAMLRTPWMALMLFDQDELPVDASDETQPETLRISAPCSSTLIMEGDIWKLSPEAPSNVLAPTFRHEHSQQPGDPVTTIDIPRSLLQAILPNPDEVRLLGHVSHSADASGVPFDDDSATLICNRLPRSERQSVVHLISLEGLYGPDQSSIWNISPDVKTVRVVTLADWRFTCLDARHDFKGLLHHLNKEHLYSSEIPVKGDFSMLTDLREIFTKLSPPVTLSKDASIELLLPNKWRVTDPGRPDYWVHQTDQGYDIHRALPHTLRLSSEHLTSARARVEEGHVALPHSLRQGNSTLSWYRGPLVPGAIAAPLDAQGQPPAAPLTADHLMRYDQRDGMFTTSYSAAWQLGRLLTLQNQKVATSLLDWKRKHRQASERERAEASLEHLPLADQSQPSPETISAKLPQDVSKWFADLALLKGLPFNYLVPDQDILPPESLRFFQVDPYWVRCLHDGAFSVGRVSRLDHDRDQTHTSHHQTQASGIVSGVLLRSELVSGWPDLAVEAYDIAIQHEDYENPLRPPEAPVPSRLLQDTAFRDSLNGSEGAIVAARLGVPPSTEIHVFTVIPDRRWAININRNETVYRVEQTPEGFDIFIEDQLPLLRMTRLSPNVLLCLFAGELKTLDIHQKPGALHFGFSHTSDAGKMRYFRELKSHLGTELPGCEVDVKFRTTAEEQGSNTVNLRTPPHSENDSPTGLTPAMTALFHAMPDSTLQTLATKSLGEDAEAITRFKTGFRKISAHSIGSDQLALQLTEGVEKVRFVLGET